MSRGLAEPDKNLLAKCGASDVPKAFLGTIRHWNRFVLLKEKHEGSPRDQDLKMNYLCEANRQPIKNSRTSFCKKFQKIPSIYTEREL
jgi:hypothetical protein